MDAELSAPGITSQQLSSSSAGNENGKTSVDESSEEKFETASERPVLGALFVHFAAHSDDNSTVNLKDDSVGDGDNENSIKKLDTEVVSHGDDKVEMGLVAADADQSVLGGAVDYNVVEKDHSKLLRGEELAVDATASTGDFSDSKNSDIESSNVVPLDGNSSLDNEQRVLENVAAKKIETPEFFAYEQNSENVAERKTDSGSGNLIGKDYLEEAKLIDPKEGAGTDALEQTFDEKIDGVSGHGIETERKVDSASGGLLGKDDFEAELTDPKEGGGIIDALEQTSDEKIDAIVDVHGIETVHHSSEPTEKMVSHETENYESEAHSRKLVTMAVEESHSPRLVEQNMVPEAEVGFQGKEEEKHHVDASDEIEGSGTDGETERMIFENVEAAILEELERRSSGASHSGADTSHDQRTSGQIAIDSDEGDTDEEGEEKEIFNSASLAALLKAATGASSDGGNITIASQDGSRLFSVERPAGLGSSLPNAKSVPRSNHPSSFNPSVVTSGRESSNNLSGEDKIKLEKLQLLRIKFLRLVQRLGQSPEESIAAQVLYRLALVAGRQTSEHFSLDSAKRKALELETEGEDTFSFSLSILVLGKNGVGKSATINSIFGAERTSINAFEPATTVVKEINGVVNGVTLRVIDTPGLKSSAVEQGANRKVLASIKKFIKNSPPDIVLYVDRLDTQTRDLNDLPLLRSITNALGSSIWKNAIITLTHAASAPPDGPSGSPLSYEVFIAQRSHVVQQSVGQAVGDLRLMNPSLMNPVSLVENHPSCRKNRDGHKVLPNGQTWRPQLLLLCYSMKILSEASSLTKPQDPFDHRKLFGFRIRSPPLPYLLSWLLQSRSHPKLSADQGGDNGDSDIDMADLSDSDQEEDEDEYDQLPPFKPLRKAQLARLRKEQRKAYFEEYDYRVKLLQKKQWREEMKRMRKMKKKGKPAVDDYMGEDVDQENAGPAAVPVPLPDMVLPPSFDADNPAFRYRFLEPTSQFLARPVLDTHGWDHDCGYDGVNIEHSMAIASHFPAAVAVQLTKDKKEFNIHLDSSIATKHGENGSSMAGFDIQNVGKQLAYIFRGETKFKNLKKNKTAAGFSVTFLGENIATGIKLEDHIAIGKRLMFVGSTGTVRCQGDSAYGANLEMRLKDADFPIVQDQSSLALSLVKWRGDLALGANLQSQFSVGRSSKIAVRAGLNNKMSGQISVRTSSSDQLQIALASVLPIAMTIYKSIKPGVSDNYSMY